ncbi:DUF1330 domain-containing protein [Aminobacter sp. NyZ550]|uniref:DUF1330 domain-containing protein n=1 Tax=Aminobacter sp. NyZ550 TaxID=2979870 RepID=UPI0021D57529|nr:DUF1330 domain-containing protein [Aminobacter sp. NyZ550]WAX93555.1 DUF1330 domain-containing protein [Aminobacter sp. NyZ550]
MPGYLIFEIEITDEAAWQHYREVAGPIMAAGGGRFVLSGDRIESLEGGWQPATISVVEFPSADAARQFYHSDDYQKVVALRHLASRGKGILVDV